MIDRPFAGAWRHTGGHARNADAHASGGHRADGTSLRGPLEAGALVLLVVVFTTLLGPSLAPANP